MAELLDITPDEYHRLDAFSATRAKTLLAQSPAHAKVMRERAATDDMERGTIIHHLVLGKGKGFEVIQADNFLTKDAKQKRDDARKAGLVPVLAHKFEDYNIAAEKIRCELAARGILLDGLSEQAITWTEHTEFGDVPCKAMFDHVWIETGIILDLKITENASPSNVEKASENYGYGVQSSAYSRALVDLDPSLAGRVAFAFAFCEPDDPWALNLSEPDGIFRELGERRWLRAVTEWARCTAEGRWPAYGSNVNPLSAPTWALAREGFTTDER